jgi:integrase
MSQEKVWLMAGKRGNDEGSIYQRKDGLWVAAISLGFHPTTGKPVRKSVYAKTRQEAAKKLQALQQTQAQGLPQARRDITVEALMTEYLATKKTEWRAKTYAYAALVSRVYIVPHLGKVKLADLDARRVSAWLRTLPSTRTPPLSPRSVQLARANLYRAVELAVRWDWVPRNVVALTDPPRSQPRKPPEASTEQARQILKAFEGHRWQAIVYLLVGCGLRIGEALGLSWDDWSPSTSRLQVRRQLSRVTGTAVGEFCLAEPKSRSGTRSIPVPKFVAQALEAQRVTQKAAQQTLTELGIAWGNSWNLIFTSGEGKPLSDNNIRRDVTRTLTESGLESLKLHDLRHLCASLLIAEGIPLTTIAQVLGHASPAITMTVYAHQLKGADEAAARALERAFSGSG